MAKKKTKGKKDENIGGLVVVAVILVILFIVVALNGNHKDYSKSNSTNNNVNGIGDNNLYIGEVELGNTTVIKAKIVLFHSDKVSTINNGDTVSFLTEGQMDFNGIVNIVGTEVKEIKPGSTVSGVLVQLDSLVNLGVGEEINIMKDDAQVGTMIVEQII